MGSVGRAFRKLRKVTKKVREKPVVTKTIHWITFFPMFIPLLLFQRYDTYYPFKPMD